MTRRRYSLVTRGMWSDAKFLGLSGPEPNAQTLWIYLLTGEVQGPIPGLFRAGLGTLADGLGWEAGKTRRALQELEDAGLLERSQRPPLVWLPKAVTHNPPASPNVVKSWGSAFRELPETDLREKAIRGIRERLQGEAFLRAFDATFPDLGKPSGKPLPKPSPKPLPKTSPNQEPRTRTKKKKKKEEGNTSPARGLAVLLRESIRSHSPRVAGKRDGAEGVVGWEVDLEKLLRIDGASEGEVRAVIRWAHIQDPSGFWRPNLLSGRKVREHFDRLIIQARQGGAAISSGAVDPTQEWMQENHRWLLRWRDERTALGEKVTEAGLLGACEEAGVTRPPKPSALLAWLGGRV